MKVIITFTFCCDNLWKSKFMALEKPGILRDFFLVLCGQHVSSSSASAAAGRQAVEDGVRLSKESLKELFTALSPPGTVRSPRIPFSAQPDDDHNDEDHRRSVREWMEKKKSERMKEFRQNLRELRSAEMHPFIPGNKTMKQVHTCALSVGYSCYFYRASAVAASPVLATIEMSVRPSVCPSVCLSVTR